MRLKDCIDENFDGVISIVLLFIREISEILSPLLKQQC
jgi:hypothetical protein